MSSDASQVGMGTQKIRQKPYSPYEMMQTLVGVKEVPGVQNNPLIMAMLQLDTSWPKDDETAWCSAALNFVCKLMVVPRSKDLRARSWLHIGTQISLQEAVPGFDVVVLKREGDNSPPDVIDAPGHVGLFDGLDGEFVSVLAGNQGDQIKISRFPVGDILGIRRLM